MGWILMFWNEKNLPTFWNRQSDHEKEASEEEAKHGKRLATQSIDGQSGEYDPRNFDQTRQNKYRIPISTVETGIHSDP